ncbi:phage tail tape measure protein [Paenibacillus sp. O199]|uniref:phage tail tape measure protein n=1 Tax=Paenibacillus sp. O199 TaxID=1643925 RepID=UPI0007BF7B31|nr:phage tail tape measure protein [Paenibacillus sp. O199]
MSDMRILIDAGLSYSSSIKNINDGIKALSQSKSLQTLSLKVNIDPSFVKSVDGFIKATQQLNKALEQQNKVVNETVKTTKMLDGSIEKVTERHLANGEVITKTNKKIDENIKRVQDETKAFNDQAKTLKQLEKELDGYGQTRSKVNKNKTGEVTGYSNTYQNTTGQKVTVNTDAEGNIKNYNQLNDYIKQQQEMTRVANEESKIRKQISDNEIKAEQKAARDRLAIDKAHGEAIKENLNRQKSMADMQARISAAQSRYKGNSSAVAELTALNAQLKDVGKVSNYKNALTELQTKLTQITSQAKLSAQSVNGLGSQFGHATQKVALWLGATAGVFAPIRMLRSGLQDIYDMDKAMTDLMKVTDETDATYKKFVQTSSSLGDSIGNTTLNVIKSSSEWARLGYDIQTAQNMAKQTLVYQNVGDIKTPEDASKQLISSIKGFGIEVDREANNVAKVVDIYNEVGNKFAISTDGIGQAVQRSASSLSSAGNTIEESVALITAANTTVQDPTKVGNALKTLSMRLRGVDEDGSAVDGLLPSLEEKFQSIGLTLKKDEKTFKNTYEIFSDLHSVWDRLSDIQRADVLELVAGKMQGNIASSMIENWNDAEGALQAGLNSFGSAAKENAAFLESMQGHIAKFKNAVSDYWGNSASRDFLNSIIDAGTKLIKTLGNVGRTVGIVGGLFIAFKSKAIVDTTISLYKCITGLFATKTAMDGAGDSASRAATKMTIFQRSLGILGLAVGVISTLVAVFSQLDNATEKMNDTIDKTNSKHEKLSGELQDSTSYYKENYNEISNNADVKNKLFELQNRLIDTYGSEASGINLVNGSYEEQIAILEKLTQTQLKNKIAEDQILVNSIQERKYASPVLSGGVFSKNYKVDEDFSQRKTKDLSLEQYYQELLNMRDNLMSSDFDKITFAGLSKAPKDAESLQIALESINKTIEDLQPSMETINQLEADKKKEIEANTSAQQNYNDTQKELFNTVSKSLSKLPTEQFKNVIAEASKEIKNFDGSNLEKTVNSIAMFSSLDGNNEVVQSLYDIFSNATKAADGMYMFGGSASEATEDTKKYAEAVSDTISDIGELNDTMYNLSKGTVLSANEMTKLTTKYPVLAKNVKELKNGYTIEKSALEALKKTKIDYFKTLDTLGQKEVIGNKQALVDKMKIWGIEIEALSTMAELSAAKAQVDMNIAAEVVVEDLTGKGIENQAVINQAKKAQQAAAGPYKELLDRIYDLNTSFKTMLGSLDDVGSAKDKDKKTTEKLNNTYTDTNEILTETQKKLIKLADAIKKVQNERSTMVKGSKEYIASLEEEKRLLDDKIATQERALQTPSELVSTKVKTTTKTASGEPAPTSSVSTSSSSTATSSGSYSGKYADIINKYASQNGVDPKLIAAIIKTESTFNPNAKSGAGAAGLMQLMPGTAKGLGVKNSYDPDQNVAGGTKYIASLLKKYNGNLEYALAAYNAGPGNVDKWIKAGKMGNIPFAETKAYAPKVLANYNEISGSSSPTSNTSSATKVKTTSSDGKTTTEVVNATQKEIDDAKRDTDLTNSSDKAQSYQLGIEIVEGVIAGSESAISALQSKRELSANKQSRFTQDSPEWRKEEMAQSSYLQQEQKLIEQQNKDIRQQLIDKKITQGEFDAKLAENSAKWWDYQAQIDEKRKNVFDSQLSSYDKQIKADDDALAVSDANLKLMTEGSVEYNKELKSQIPILEHKSSVLAKEIEYTKSLLASGKLNAEMTAYYNDKLQEFNLSLLGTNSALADVNKTLKDLRESAADNVIEEYKKVIEKQRDLALEALDQEREKEDKRHKERTKNIDDEQKQFENYINARLKAFDRENAGVDYEEELKKKMEERQKVQDKFNRYSMDDTMEGKAVRKELQDQLDALDEEIFKYQRDRERELIKQGLQDQLDDNKNYNDKIKDEEDKLHDDTLDKIDEEKKKTERKYKDILEDQKKFYELKKGLMSNDAIVVTATLGIIGGEYDKLFANIKDHTFETSQEMQNMINEVQTSLENLNKFKIGDYTNTEAGSGGSGSNTTNNGSTGTIKGTPAARQAWTEYLSNKQQAENMKEEMKKFEKGSMEYKGYEQQFNQLKSKNDQLRSVYGFPDGSYKDLVSQKIFSAETGGMTPAWGSGGKLLLAHEKEMILNKSDTGNMLKAVDITRSIVDNISKVNLSSIIPSFNNKQSTPEQKIIKYEITNNITAQPHHSVKDVASEVASAIKKIKL